MSRMLHSSNPAVLFAGARGDHVLVVPALRALASIFAGRLRLVCIPTSRQTYFSDLQGVTVYERNLLDDASGPKVRVAHDVESLAQDLKECDLLISLNSWFHPEIGELIQRLGIKNSIGFFDYFQTALDIDYSIHMADLNFAIPRYIEPSLRLEDFSQPLALGPAYRKYARLQRKRLPPGTKVLAVHADTKPQKMWSPDRFAELLELFLARHPDYAAWVVGGESLAFNAGERIFLHYDLPLSTAMALVAEADLFVGIDSCMLHVADLGRVPGVAIFGPTDPVEWGYRIARPHQHIRGANNSMEEIEVGQVLEALEAVLAELPAEDASCLMLQA